MYSSKTFKNGDSGLTRTLRRPFLTTRSERRSGVSAFLLGSNVWPLLDESTPIVPEAVMQSQGVLQVIIFQSPRFRIYPLIRGKSENELNVGSRRAGPTIASYKPWKSRIRKILKKRANFFQLVSDLFCVVKRGFIEPCKNVLCNKLPYMYRVDISRFLTRCSFPKNICKTCANICTCYRSKISMATTPAL
jgi:hypothetical protein